MVAVEVTVREQLQGQLQKLDYIAGFLLSDQQKLFVRLRPE